MAEHNVQAWSTERADLPLSAITIGLSIADSPDLQIRGLSDLHLQDAFVELTRHLLALGATVAYGGDHRRRGFSDILFELLYAYDHPDKPPPERVRNYLAWPIYLGLDASIRANLRPICELIQIPPPPDLGIDDKVPVGSDSKENRYVWARCLTAMRQQMNADVTARVLLGGREIGYKGKYPGLAEEAILALRAEAPLFLLGGFGGCTNAIIEAVLGKRPQALTTEFQRSASAEYAEMVDFYNSRHPECPIDYDALRREFAATGVRGLRNGLHEEENRRLFVTDDIDELVALTVRGLMNASP